MRTFDSAEQSSAERSGWPRTPPPSSRICHSRTPFSSSISTPRARVAQVREGSCAGSSATGGGPEAAIRVHGVGRPGPRPDTQRKVVILRNRERAGRLCATVRSGAHCFGCQSAISPPAGVATTLRHPTGPSRGSSTTEPPSTSACAVASARFRDLHIGEPDSMPLVLLDDSAVDAGAEVEGQVRGPARLDPLRTPAEELACRRSMRAAGWWFGAPDARCDRLALACRCRVRLRRGSEFIDHR
jgi:hypothetical protein